MTQFFAEDGTSYPATIVQADPCTVTQVKTVETDGYNAIQLGAGRRKAKNVNKAQLGLWGSKVYQVVREFRLTETNPDTKAGDILVSTDIFEVGDKIHVTGTSKGKGFQGVVKRHGFAGGRRSHGQKHSEREPGSIGSTGPQRVFKGTRMGGRMGSDRTTVKNLRVLNIDKDSNQIIIKGALPGRRGTILEIRSATEK